MSVTLIDNSEYFLSALNQQLQAGLETVGLQAEAYAKLKCAVDTGRLRNSITHDVQSSDNTVYVGTNVEYAAYVEYGHHQTPGRYVPQIGKRLKRSFVPAQPFLRPALSDHIEEYKRIILTFLKK